MISLDDDEILGEFFDSPKKKAKFLIRIKYAYILWIFFVILGIMFVSNIIQSGDINNSLMFVLLLVASILTLISGFFHLEKS